jgi:hypothetical protein
MNNKSSTKDIIVFRVQFGGCPMIWVVSISEESYRKYAYISHYAINIGPSSNASFVLLNGTTGQ